MSVQIMVHIGHSSDPKKQQRFEIKTYSLDADPAMHLQLHGPQGEEVSLVFHEAKRDAAELVYQLADYLGIDAGDFVQRAIERVDADNEVAYQNYLTRNEEDRYEPEAV